MSSDKTVSLEPATASGEGVEEPATASGEGMEEPVFASSEAMEEPVTASNFVLKQPSFVSGGGPKGTPTASGDIPKEQLSVCGVKLELDYAHFSNALLNRRNTPGLDKKATKEDKNIPKETSVDLLRRMHLVLDSSVSSLDLSEHFTSSEREFLSESDYEVPPGDRRIYHNPEDPSSASIDDLKESPTVSGDDLKVSLTSLVGGLKVSPTASGGGQKEPFSVSFEESELDYSFLSTLMKKIGSFQLCVNLEGTDLDKKGIKGDANIPKDTSSSGLPHQTPPVSIDFDSSSESKVEVEPKDGNVIHEIKKKISRTKLLLHEAEDAMLNLFLIERSDRLAKDIVNDFGEFVFFCKDLISKIESHIKEVNALAKRMIITQVEVDPGTLNPDHLMK